MIDGFKVEDLFIKSAPKEWIFLSKANKNEDMYEHWDVKFLINNHVTSFDIKAHKAIYRDGPLLNDWFWVEWLNVRGNPGWLCGRADFIAFEYFGQFLIYNRFYLCVKCRELVDFNKTVKNSRQAFNCIYQRFGRKDQISMVEINKLDQPDMIIPVRN